MCIFYYRKDNLNKETENIIEFTLAFNRYKAKLYNYVNRMVNDRMTAQDIVQNVFMKYFESIDKIKNKSSANFWLFKTARNEALSHLRGRKARVDQFNVFDVDELEINSGISPEETIESMELEIVIKMNLEKMDPEQSEVFLLKEYSGLSYKEIAEIMNIDENLVKSRLYKTRQKLIGLISKLIN